MKCRNRSPDLLIEGGNGSDLGEAPIIRGKIGERKADKEKEEDIINYHGYRRKITPNPDCHDE